MTLSFLLQYQVLFHIPSHYSKQQSFILSNNLVFQYSIMLALCLNAKLNIKNLMNAVKCTLYDTRTLTLVWYNRIIKYALRDLISFQCIQWGKFRNHNQEAHLLKKIIQDRVNLTENFHPTIYLLYSPNVHLWKSFHFKYYKGEMRDSISQGLCSG